MESAEIEKSVITILCVDDEKNILSSLRRLLRPEGYEIQLANSGAEGLDILSKMPIDLVISDMRMPEMNGAQFLEKVYELYPDTVRILLTGYSEISSTIDAINKGSIYKYISKPWEEHDLKLTLRNALAARSVEKERDGLLLITKKQNDELKAFNSNLEGLVKQRTSEVEQTMGMLEVTFETLKNSYSNTILIFSRLVEMREGTLRSQSHEVSRDAQALALQLRMNADTAKSLQYAGMLREIGKIGLAPRVILSILPHAAGEASPVGWPALPDREPGVRQAAVGCTGPSVRPGPRHLCPLRPVCPCTTRRSGPRGCRRRRGRG